MARGRRAGQRQRQPLRAEARRRGRLHQHQPERAKARLRRHLHRRRARRSRSRTASLRIVAGRPRAQVRRRGRADHLQRRLCRRAGPAGALRHRALRVPAHRGGPGAGRGRARHRHRARHPGAHGLPARSSRESAPMDARIFRAEPMGLGGHAARPAARRARQLRRRAQHRCSSTSRACTSATRTTSSASATRGRAALPGDRPQGRGWSSTTTPSGSTTSWPTPTRMVRDLHDAYYTTASRYTTSAFMRLKLGDALHRRESRRTSFETAVTSVLRR